MSQESTSANRRESLDSEVGEALAKELLAVCISGLREYGFSALKLRDWSSQATVNGGKIPTTSKLTRDAELLGELATEWTENTMYVDESGRPKVLPIEGPLPSFSSLARKYFPGRDVHYVLEFGLKTRVLERVDNDKIAQFGACVIFAGNPTLMLAHAIQSIRGFLGTTLENASSNRARRLIPLPDRKASALISEGHLPEFIAVMRDSIVNTTEIANRWLAARELKPGRNKKAGALKVGVHAYLFHEGPWKD